MKIKNSLIHHTQYKHLFMEMVTINEILYVGLQRTRYYEGQPRPKSILVPVEAWPTLVTVAVPVIEKTIKEHQATHPAPAETAPSKMRAYRNGIILSSSFLLYFLDIFEDTSAYLVFGDS